MIVVGNAKLRSLGDYLGGRLTAAFAFDLLVVTAYVFLGWKWLALPDVPLSICGGIIGLMAGFRNSSAYSRWWEARTIWGGVINHSRNFAREVLSMIVPCEPDVAVEWEVEETKHRLVVLQIAYVHALRHHLRGTAPWVDLYGLLPE